MEKKHIYISETHTLYEDNGEIYIIGDFGEIVWNCETLYTDLPHIINLVFKARQKTNKNIKDQIRNLL